MSGNQNEKNKLTHRCCVCEHDLSSHIDEVAGWRCHALGVDGYQCECFLRKYTSLFDLDFFDLDRRMEQHAEEFKRGEG